MFNPGIPIVDLLLDGESVLDESNQNEILKDTLSIESIFVGTTLNGVALWRLEAIESDSSGWERVLTMVDSCGFETSALLRVRDCELPNVFTPNNDSTNDNFRIRGLDGFMGSRLLIYNRNGTLVFQDKTATNGQFELVWNGRDNNGDAVSDGIYQWVLIRPDGFSDRGQLTLNRKKR